MYQIQFRLGTPLRELLAGFEGLLLREGRGRGGEEDFRVFPQFQIGHYTTACNMYYVTTFHNIMRE